MSPLTTFLASVRERLSKATRTEWICFYTYRDCIDDLDLMRSSGKQHFSNEHNAKEFAKGFTFKNRPEYWQPRVEKYVHNDRIDIAPSDLAKLIAIVEQQAEALKHYAEKHTYSEHIVPPLKKGGCPIEVQDNGLCPSGWVARETLADVARICAGEAGGGE